MQLEATTVAMSDIRPVEKNVRLHPKKQVEELKKSYNMFGQYRPFIVTHDGEILVGNGMYQAMSELGVETAEVKRLPADAPEEYKKKLMLADNKIYMLGADDIANIDEIMGSMDDFEIPGFDAPTLEALYADFEEVDFSQYGIVAPEKKEQIEATEAKREEEPRADVSHKEADEERAANPEKQVLNAAAGSEDRHSGSYVTCPNCGMKIWQ